MDNLENEYRKRFQTYEEEPADFAWENIQARIEEKPTRRLAIVWWRYGIAAGVLIGLFLSFYLFNQSTKTNKNTVISKVENKTQPTDNQIIKQGEDINRSSKFAIPMQSDTDLKSENALAQQNTKQSSSKFAISTQSDTDLKSESTLTQQNTKQSSSGFAIPMQSDKDLKSESTLTQQNTKQSSSGFAIPMQSDKDLQSIALNESEKSDVVLEELKIKEATELAIVKLINQTPTYESLNAELFDEKDDRKLVFVAPSEIFANITPTLNYYMFSPNTADDFVVSSFQNNKDRLGFAAQVGFTYSIAKKTSIRTAFSYFSGKSQVQYTSLAVNEPKNVKLLDNYSVQFETPHKTQTESLRWQYLEMQSDLLYDVKRNQAVSMGLRAGVKTSDLRDPILNARIGYRFSKPVGNRFALWVEPSLSVMLTKQNSINNLYIYRTTGLGMNMGVSLLK
ncbi:MAG: hypothetical protein ACK4NY_00220 [Spirosomataceae bacterium]